MSPQAITLEIQGATLFAVPAVHYRLPFAEAVNHLCRDQATRPDAIAVELGPAAAAAVLAWLRELGLGPSGRRRLPCMLGLHRARHLLHPSARERALDLQRETGTELHQLPPRRLKDELGFSGLAVLPLSPTDSIIEAVRCACELDIPVYGVDLEESADRASEVFLVEDPWRARGAVRDYAVANARRACLDPDPPINARREGVMASRLAAVLKRHRRVLFTCGLGHWARLAVLLQETSLRPAEIGLIPDQVEIHGWRRGLIHPGVAITTMEWPNLSWRWERVRPHPLLGLVGPPLPPRAHADFLATALRHAYRAAQDLTDDMRRGAALDSAHFARLLRGESLLELRTVPTTAAVMRCAAVTLPGPVVTALGKIWLRFPWAKSSRFRDLDRIGSDSSAAPDEVALNPRGPRTPASLVQGGEPISCDRELARIADELESHPRERVIASGTYQFSWRPWERLATALCVDASARDAAPQRVRVLEPFSGQLLDGIDIRGTLREYARGQDQPMVRDTRPALGSMPRPLIQSFPVVWIFEAADSRQRHLNWLRTPLPWLLEAARDRAALAALVDRPGEDLMDMVLVADTQNAADRAAMSHGITTYQAHGWVLFRPQCPTLRQAGDWILETQSRLRPSAPRNGGDRLPLPLLQRLDHDGGPRLGDLSWQDALIRVALTFADRDVTVVAPADFVLSRAISVFARQQGRLIEQIPLTQFPTAQVDRIRQVQLVSAVIQGEAGRIRYLGRPSDLLGEPEDAYRELVPPQWRRFLW